MMKLVVAASLSSADLEARAVGADALGVVLDDLELVLVGNLLDGRHVGALAVEVDRDDGLGLGGDGRLDLAPGQMHLVSGQQSTKTAVAPAIQIASAVAKNVFGCVMTSSPGPMPRAMRASQMASVPLPRPTAIFGAVIGGQLGLELLEHRAHDVLAALQDRLDILINLRFDIMVLPDVAVKFNFHAPGTYSSAGPKQEFSLR